MCTKKEKRKKKNGGKEEKKTSLAGFKIRTRVTKRPICHRIFRLLVKPYAKSTRYNNTGMFVARAENAASMAHNNPPMRVRGWGLGTRLFRLEPNNSIHSL